MIRAPDPNGSAPRSVGEDYHDNTLGRMSFIALLVPDEKPLPALEQDESSKRFDRTKPLKVP
jgi:hypothetical protein